MLSEIHSFGGEGQPVELQTGIPTELFKNKAVLELWEGSTPDFRQNTLLKVLDGTLPFDDNLEIILSLCVYPLLRLRSRGITEEELAALSPWEYRVLDNAPLSYDDYCETRDACGITEETPFEEAVKLLGGINYELQRNLTDSEYETYKRMMACSKVPGWVKDTADIVLFMHVCTRFRVGHDRIYLNNVKYLTKEDAKFLLSLGKGDLFGCLCLKPLFGQEHNMTSGSWLSAAGFNMSSYKPLQWFRIDTPSDSTTIPIYTYYKNREWLTEKLTLKVPSNVTMHNEGNQLVIAIDEYGDPARSLDYEPAFDANACGRDCEDPVLTLSRKILSDLGVKKEISDFDIYTKMFFVFLEVSEGHDDWLQALESDSFNSIFKFYRKGDSLADTLWRFLSAALRLDYRLKKSSSSAGKIRVDGEWFSIYDVLGDADELIKKLRLCRDKGNIEVY